ncbi:glycosyltransferase family 1 protein [Phlebiopsis gigantea 11061_1 CR5-6]|uniref:Glycosyltransferase family 1 protein n=1 Tax=Phlebiopsis gigantea (strain 11061_1 CR5-6) TaxID=745531 RepID=A0A0C3P1A4_PHLG1|nr:glycosyltransferase family 1 protein [Phlebiopsis gigantea 11061_1 CR5-6]
MVHDVDLHIAFMAYQAWGHTKPLCSLSAQITKFRPVHITFFTARHMYKKVVTEISRNFEDEEQDNLDRIRVVGLDCHEQDPYDVDVVGKRFGIQIQKLLNSEPVICANTNRELPSLRPPSTLLVDIFGYTFLQIARSHSSDLKILAWAPGSLVALFCLFGPFEPNSVGKLQHRVEELASQPGNSIANAAEIILNTPTEEIVHVPGLPPLYRYEGFPQEVTSSCAAYDIYPCTNNNASIRLSWNLIQECDGIVASAFQNVEPVDGLQAIAEFYRPTSRQVYIVGPLLPSTKRAAAVEMEEAAKSPEIMTFMDETLRSHGEKSLIYISFGTVFWPSNSENLWTFLDVLMERGVPFTTMSRQYTHPPKKKKVPDQVVEKIRLSGLGVLTTWAPQQVVLDHPVTGWFVTHSGYNSYSESILAGVPMICWPIGADQPVNTIHLTENLNVAYELLEVRTGHGLRPIYRTGRTPLGTSDAIRAEARGVLDKAFGADGAEKRANVRRLREASLRLWEHDGAARRAAEEFLDSSFAHDAVKRLSMGSSGQQADESRTTSVVRLLGTMYSTFMPSILAAYVETVFRLVSKLWSTNEPAE